VISAQSVLKYWSIASPWLVRLIKQSSTNRNALVQQVCRLVK
jgi:hypothetical protein